MKDILTRIYNETTLSWRPYHPSIDENENEIKISFIEGAKIEIIGDQQKEYQVDFIDGSKNRNIYSTKIRPGMWSSTSIRYFTNWKILVKCDDKIVREEIFDLTRKKVKVICDTNSMGDLIAYIGAIDLFQKKHGCELSCVVFEPTFNKIFKENYPNINFLLANDLDSLYYASYRLGYYYDEWEGKISTDPKQLSLSSIAANILGLGDIEVKTKLKVDKPNNVGKRYVCIGTQSTAQYKYWNRAGGWEEVIKYLNGIGYEVWCIDKYKYFGTNKYQNSMPNGAIDKTGDFPIEERMKQIAGADFFIGLTSGLSWLAWSIGTPVIMISGISDVWTEFYSPFRVELNKNVCHGCANEIPFDKSKWDFCPKNKDFECTKEITAEAVIEKIEEILDKDHRKDLEYIEEQADISVREKYMIYKEFFKKTGTVYEKFFKVEKNDVVVDVGGFLGWFSLAASKRNPKKIFTLEPGASRQDSIKNKLKGAPYTLLNVGISDKRQFVKNGLNFKITEDFSSITFSDFIKENNIDKIDFLKIDCEGGEYDIFTDENFDWIVNNVKKIAGEWHIGGPNPKQKFIKFRDKYLKKFKNYKVWDYSGETDIKWSLFNDDFVDNYSEVLVYIDLRDGLLEDVSARETEPNLLITGISGGLGGAFEKECTSRNIKFFGQANKNNRDERYQSCDFSNIEDVYKMEEYISKNNINCLINNAGIYSSENLLSISDKRIQDILNVNLVSPILLSKYLYKHLVSTNQSGWIININSLAGKYPNYNESVYCASKFGLSGFGSSISINQKETKIKVVDVYVGAMKTEMTKNRENHFNFMQPQEVASFVLDLIQTKTQYVPTSIELRNRQ